MNALPQPGDELTPDLPLASNARRLLWIRTIAIPGAAVWLLLAREFFGLMVPATPLLVIAGALVVCNGWIGLRLRSGRRFHNIEFFLQMMVDMVALTAILYLSGGASNPFVFFFLLPLTIAAAVLPPRYAWAVALVSACCYTFLLVVSRPVPQFTHGSQFNAQLHVLGMWIGFVVITALIAHFVAAMAETLRQRERDLARMRETALLDERVVAVGTLAAGAAHELSTPLATMAVVTGELARDYPAKDYGHLHRQLQILKAQIQRCKEALSVISASAGAARAGTAEPVAVDRFVREAVDEVRRLRPGAQVRLELSGEGPPPDVVVERTVKQALLNVLHNAVDVSPRWVTMQGHWNPERIELVVMDRGGGFRAGQPGALDRAGISTKEGGLGLGLFLSHAALGQLGGELSAGDNGQGGTTVTMSLPLDRLRAGVLEQVA